MTLYFTVTTQYPLRSWSNIMMWSSQCRKSHCGDKMVVNSSDLYNGISYTGKMASLFQISPLYLFKLYVHWNSQAITFSVHENHQTYWTFLIARPKCLMRDFTNLNRIYKAHQTNVWWTKKVFQVHCTLFSYHWISTTIDSVKNYDNLPYLGPVKTGLVL